MGCETQGEDVQGLIEGNSPIVATYRKDEPVRNGEAVWSGEVVWSEEAEWIGEAVWIEEGHFMSNHS